MSAAFFGKGVGASGGAVMADTAPKEIMGLAGRSVQAAVGNQPFSPHPDSLHRQRPSEIFRRPLFKNKMFIFSKIKNK